MDKKQTSLSGLVRKTEPFPGSPNADPGSITSDATTIINIGLKRSEIDRLDVIAAENSVTRNNLVAYALRRFVRQYDAGKAHVVKKTTRFKKP
jgi:hypothetical protein